MLKILIMLSLFVLLVSACEPPTPEPPTPTPVPTATPEPSPTPEGERAGWNLVWRDEFNGDAIDLNNWMFDLGANGWGNSELEQYTDSTDNARLENGMLVIEARKDENTSYGYSSARMKSQGLQSWQYGRVEARLQLPYGQGIWPAFWMLGEDINTARWPNCGEIDIMEFIGKEPDTVYNTVHGPGYAGAHGIGAHTVLTAGALKDNFHVYAIEWEANEIRWYIDDAQVFKVTATDAPGKWVFDHKFFIILNVAVGGGWPGYPDATTAFPQRMLVDYVRVYQKP